MGSIFIKAHLRGLSVQPDLERLSVGEATRVWPARIAGRRTPDEMDNCEPPSAKPDDDVVVGLTSSDHLRVGPPQCMEWGHFKRQPALKRRLLFGFGDRPPWGAEYQLERFHGLS